jgi:diadenosine tetraphosphate (Ap4A) HIT family hydrolase
MFRLDARLDRDTVPVTDLGLCRALLMDDARYPWLILVPARPDLRELHDLDATDRNRLVDEICRASRALERLFQPDKINVGALGNLVPQLHIHVIARRVGDSAWPGPVWGQGAAESYGAEALAEARDRLAEALAAGPPGASPREWNTR